MLRFENGKFAWHQRMGHCSHHKIRQMVKLVDGMKLTKSSKKQNCVACAYAKQTKKKAYFFENKRTYDVGIFGRRHKHFAKKIPRRIQVCTFHHRSKISLHVGRTIKDAEGVSKI